MSLLDRVVEALREARLPFALIGATAMSSYGVARSTFDQDLLTLGAEALLPETWSRLGEVGAAVEIRRGDVFDPLAGVVRLAPIANIGGCLREPEGQTVRRLELVPGVQQPSPHRHYTVSIKYWRLLRLRWREPCRA